MYDKARRLRVLHIIPSVAACRGGPSKAVIDMVSSLRELDVDAEIATTNDDGRHELDVELNRLISYKGVPTRFFKRFSPPVSAIREFSYSRSFSRWLSSNIGDYDVIHIHAIFSYCSSYAMRLARKKKVPYIIRPIGQLQNWSLEQSKIKKSLYLTIIERANIEGASAIHFTAQSEQQEASTRFTFEGHVIPLGINAPKNTTLSKDQAIELWNATPTQTIILYLSRLHEKKGLDLLLRALATIEQQDFKLLIAGEGEHAYKTELNNLCKKLGIDEKCHFLGHIDGDEKAAALQHSDLYALTSYSENFGIAVLEAMASGLTPLVSNEVALSSVIKSQKLGLVCRLKIDDIASKLRFAFTQPEETKSMGLNAKHYAIEHYSWQNIATQLNELYRSVS